MVVDNTADIAADAVDAVDDIDIVVAAAGVVDTDIAVVVVVGRFDRETEFEFDQNHPTTTNNYNCSNFEPGPGSADLRPF